MSKEKTNSAKKALLLGLLTASPTLGSLVNTPAGDLLAVDSKNINYSPPETDLSDVFALSNEGVVLDGVRINKVIEKANDYRVRAFSNDDNSLIKPSGSKDKRLEIMIRKTINSIKSLDDFTILEKMMTFKLAMLGQTEYSIGDVKLGNNLGVREDGRQAGQNTGGIVTVLSDILDINPSMWCSSFILATDKLFAPNIHPNANASAKSHISEARAKRAYADKDSPYVPKMGDRMVFDSADPKGSKASGHIATVLAYDEQTDLISFIDGNSNSSVLADLVYSSDGLELNDAKRLQSGGMVGLNSYKLADLKEGVANVKDPEAIRNGTLLGFVKTRELAKASGIDINKTTAQQGNARHR